MNTLQEIVDNVEARLNYTELFNQTKGDEKLLINIPGIEPFHINKCSEIMGSLEKIMAPRSGFNPSPQLARVWEVVKLLNDNKEYIDEARHNDENWVAAVIERFNEKLKKNPAGFYTFAKAFKLVADLTRQKAQPKAPEKSLKPEENHQYQQVKEFMAQLKNVFQPEDEDMQLNPTSEFDEEWQTPISMFPQKPGYAEKTQEPTTMPERGQFLKTYSQPEPTTLPEPLDLVMPHKVKSMVILRIPGKKKKKKNINDNTSIVETRTIESLEYVRSQEYDGNNNGNDNGNNNGNKNIVPCVDVKPSIEKPATDLGELVRKNQEKASAIESLSTTPWKRHYNPLNCHIKEKKGGIRICKEGEKQLECANAVKSLDGRIYSCSVPRGRVY